MTDNYYLRFQILAMATTESSSSGKWTLYFLVSLVVIIVMLATPSLRQWFWLSLPFVVLSFAKWLKIM
jgi:hypothetical protein